MSEQYIPINKGNYSMETKEREELFEQHRGQGWEAEYKRYRENWIKYPKEQIISEYPLQVDIEVSSLCNLKCPMCYTITDEFKSRVNTKLIDEKLFYKLIDEISGKVPAVRLSLRGEPTLHPKLIDFIKYCKGNGIGEVSFLTNGSKLSKEYFIELMNAGIDWITLSIDGTYETYNSIRKPNKFEEIYQKIQDIRMIKQQANMKKPVIKIQTVWPAIRENPTEYYQLFKSYVDLIAFNPLIDYLDNDEDIIYEANFSCPQLYQRMIIYADGLVSICSNDELNDAVIGNANIESIYNIWHGEKLNNIRNIHKKCDGFLDIQPCRKCYLPRKTEDNEVSIIDDREIIIKSYINRSQRIGE